MELFPELNSRLRTLPSFQPKTAFEDHVRWNEDSTLGFSSIGCGLHHRCIRRNRPLEKEPVFGALRNDGKNVCRRTYQSLTSVRETKRFRANCPESCDGSSSSGAATTPLVLDPTRRRLPLWKAGRIDELIREGRTIQALLTSTKRSRNGITQESFHRTFANLVFSGKVSAAMRLLDEFESDNVSRGVLDLKSPASPGSSATVEDVLFSSTLLPPT